MHKAVPVNKDTWWVGVNDHETDLFESLWDLPQGVSYNAYVVTGEKTAAIDTVKGPWLDEYFHKLEEVLLHLSTWKMRGLSPTAARTRISALA